MWSNSVRQLLCGIWLRASSVVSLWWSVGCLLLWNDSTFNFSKVLFLFVSQIYLYIRNSCDKTRSEYPSNISSQQCLMILSFELQLAQCATGFFSSCVTDIDFGHPLAVCLMCGITFLKIFLCPSFQEERPWDSVRYTSWNSTGQRVSAGGHWRCRAQKPRGQVQLHGRPHCPEDWTWLEHCKVRSFFVRNSN